MSNIAKRDNGGITAWNPFRAMRDLFRRETLREMLPALGGLESMREDSWLPCFEVRETRDAYVFKADVPGIAKDDLDVTLRGDRLQIAGKREAERHAKDDTFFTYERSFGSFSRGFTLPADADVDHVRSDLADGVLTLIVPRKAEARTTRIAIDAGSRA